MTNIRTKYLLFENITYQTKLDLREILNRIGEVTEPIKTFRMTDILENENHKPYEGIIDGYSFNIKRIIGYRNSFLPEIKGVVENNLDGTSIKVKMRLHTLVIIFMFIWFGGIGITCIVSLSTFFNSKNIEPTALISFGMLIFGYVLFTGGFKYESVKSKKYLAELFESKIQK